MKLDYNLLDYNKRDLEKIISSQPDLGYINRELERAGLNPIATMYSDELNKYVEKISEKEIAFQEIESSPMNTLTNIDNEIETIGKVIKNIEGVVRGVRKGTPIIFSGIINDYTFRNMVYEKEYIEKEYKYVEVDKIYKDEQVLKNIHSYTDWAELIPFIGTPIALYNAGLYFYDGDIFDGTLSLFTAIPIEGAITGAGVLVVKGIKGIKKAIVPVIRIDEFGKEFKTTLKLIEKHANLPKLEVTNITLRCFTENYKTVFSKSKFFITKTGFYVYPKSNGFLKGISWIKEDGFKEGDIIVKTGFKEDSGQFFTNEGTPFEKLSLPPSNNTKYGIAKVYKYEVKRQIEKVREGGIEPWFNEPGGGKQYHINRDEYEIYDKNTGEVGKATLENLINFEYLKVIK